MLHRERLLLSGRRSRLRLGRAPRSVCLLHGKELRVPRNRGTSVRTTTEEDQLNRDIDTMIEEAARGVADHQGVTHEDLLDLYEHAPNRYAARVFARAVELRKLMPALGLQR